MADIRFRADDQRNKPYLQARLRRYMPPLRQIVRYGLSLREMPEITAAGPIRGVVFLIIWPVSANQIAGTNCEMVAERDYDELSPIGSSTHGPGG